ncbi:uncharacterized protein LOC121853178 isoform X2 [Homarus americanus]|uniref:uncharacterized protein LOC121853178 isoform X2 n=1 Tax=Homarus americanus TaxID=6706 RepID=UPI001C44667C|nr:uncharacterized protein LOC121853178 isoform X2 [Homarus americanus]
MSCSVLHHVEVCVKEENNLLRLLTHGFGFHVFGRRVTPCASTWALRSGTSVFTVIKRNRLVGCGRYQSYGFAAENNAEDKVPSKNKQSSPKGSSLQMMTTSSNENVTTRSHCGSSSGDKLNLDGDKSSRLYSTESSQNLSKLVCCKDASLEKRLNEYNEHWTVFCCRDGVIHSLDSVFNIALVVKDVDSVTERVRSRGGQVLREPANISDMFGQVRYSIVTSCCGNIVHTLIDKKNYEGDFLPGYEAIKECYGNAWVDTSITNGDRKQLSVNCTVPVNKSDFPPVLQNNYGSNEIFEQTLLNTADSTCYPQGGIKLPTAAPICTYIDHITYVCEAGKSNDLIDWYEHCFGMKRFMTNSEETEDGFVLGGNIGLRLKALEYWRCAEKGLAAPNASINDSSLKVVIAEPLPDVNTSCKCLPSQSLKKTHFSLKSSNVVVQLASVLEILQLLQNPLYSLSNKLTAVTFRLLILKYTQLFFFPVFINRLRSICH